MAMRRSGAVHGSADRRRRDRRADPGPHPREGRHPRPGVRVVARDQAGRGRHQPLASRDEGAGPARARHGAVARRGGDAGGGFLQPVRPAHLSRAARTGGRIRLAAVLGAPRRPPGRAPRSGPAAARGGPGPRRAEGRQLVNWVAEIETPRHQQRDWNRRGRLEDFLGAFEAWHFDWLDVPAFIRAADCVLEFPMVDQDPLPWWTQGRVTLLGDAAHPMVPRGSNGAGQAILDARALVDALLQHADPADALRAYETKRLEATANVVRMSRKNPPDAILREVFVRSGDRPFERIEDVIGLDELKAISDGYKRVAGYDRESLAEPGGGR